MLTKVGVRERRSGSVPSKRLTSGDAKTQDTGQQLVLPLTELAGIPPRPSLQVRVTSPSRAAASVAAFHRAFGLPLLHAPNVEDVPAKLLRLRESLLEEEVAEYMAASHRRDLIGIADALADIVYVAYGSALTFGLNLDALLEEVHRSNMSKLDDCGRPVLRSDGKVLKSPKYREPDVRGLLERQLPLPF